MDDTYRDVFGGPKGSQVSQVDLNTASQKELAKLPGLTDEDAARIIANRPYGNVQGLLRKNVVGEKKYEKIQDYVYVSQNRR
jgi:competence protein ComEA